MNSEIFFNGRRDIQGKSSSTFWGIFIKIPKLISRVATLLNSLGPRLFIFKTYSTILQLLFVGEQYLSFKYRFMTFVVFMCFFKNFLFVACKCHTQVKICGYNKILASRYVGHSPSVFCLQPISNIYRIFLFETIRKSPYRVWSIVVKLR